MTKSDFFAWLRSIQKDSKLSQFEVKVADKLLQHIDAKSLKAWLIDIGDIQVGMSLSDKGLAIIKEFEGFRSAPYRDAVGIWTIGYGNTYYPDGRRVSGSDAPLTKAEASQLKLDIINQDFAPAVNMIIEDEIKAGKITQNMFDALVSLAYNIGVTALTNSSVIRYLKRGDKQRAADSFLLWNKAGGRVLQGLVRRRRIERNLFLS